MLERVRSRSVLLLTSLPKLTPSRLSKRVRNSTPNRIFLSVCSATEPARLAGTSQCWPFAAEPTLIINTARVPVIIDLGIIYSPLGARRTRSRAREDRAKSGKIYPLSAGMVLSYRAAAMGGAVGRQMYLENAVTELPEGCGDDEPAH